jgi:multicomponent Na+:H+ antiporter subunit C
MSAAFWYAVTGLVLFAVGLYGLIAGEPFLRKLLGVNIMGSGVFLILVAGAYRGVGETPDPVPHALVLTGIVVAVSTTALALALARHAGSNSDSNADE